MEEVTAASWRQGGGGMAAVSNYPFFPLPPIFVMLFTDSFFRYPLISLLCGWQSFLQVVFGYGEYSNPTFF